jgi:hypothetical protein
MRITIEDLEALKELNDELEENHIETERQLTEDLGMMKCNFFTRWTDHYSRVEGNTDSGACGQN